MRDWRKNIEALMDYLEADCADKDKRSLASLIYFVGEVETDGIMGYLDRHDAEDIQTLEYAAGVIESEELMRILGDIRKKIDTLPHSKPIADQLSLHLEKTGKDPFEKLDVTFQSLRSTIEAQIDRVVSDFLQ